MKFLYFGDPHIRGTSPQNRTDDYKTALIAKLREVFELARVHNVKAIIQPGDTFDRPEVSSGILLEFADVLAESPVPIYTTPGNHDLYSYNLDTFKRTSLAVLERLVPQLHVIQKPDKPTYFEEGEGGFGVQLTFTPYSSRIDIDGYGYSHEVENVPADVFTLHVAHGMLLDHEPPFDRFTLVQDVETNADLVLTGHDHTGYGVFQRRDGKTFANLGSLTRLSASRAEIERHIEVALIEIVVEDDMYVHSVSPIRLISANPGDEVLDRSKIEENAARKYAMDTFATLIQANGETVAVDVDAIITAIAKSEGINENVVKIALDKIAEMRNLAGG